MIHYLKDFKFNCRYTIISAAALLILFAGAGSGSSNDFCFGAGCHAEPGSFINSSLFDNSSHRYLQCIDCHVNVTQYPNATHGDFTETLTLPLPSSSYNSSDFLLCYGCHKESSIIGLESAYSNSLWSHTIITGYPLTVSNISTNFANEIFPGHNFGNFPANIHWDHLDMHKIDAGEGPDLIWDSNRDGVLDSMISCPACHDPHGNTSGPNLTRDDLGIRHGIDAVGEYGEVTGIEYQRAGGDVYCAGCHGVGVKYYRSYRDVLNFSDLHISQVNMTGCIQSGCHYSNVLTIEHIEKRNLSCAACHQSSDQRVINAIEQGNKSCFSCHSPHTTGSHLTHLGSAKGPYISCSDCHGTHSPPLLADGQTLDNTAVCDTCHSPGGTYDGMNDPEIGARYNWAGVYNNSDDKLKTGKEKWCAGCHDGESSLIQGVEAPNITGDGLGYGYYITGHGANEIVGCGSCHNLSSRHIDGTARTYSPDSDYLTYDPASGAYQGGYRLKDVLSGYDGKYPMHIPRTGHVYPPGFREDWEFALCFECHNKTRLYDGGFPENGSGAGTNFRENYSSIWVSLHDLHTDGRNGPGGPETPQYDSDFDGTADSRMNCPACHNVHGSRSPTMVRTGELIGRVPALNLKYVDNAPGDPLHFIPRDMLNASTGAGMDVSFGPGQVSSNGVCNMCHAQQTGGPEPRTAYYRDPVDTIGCALCHSAPSGANGERRAILGSNGEFNSTSHHVYNSTADQTAKSEDCLVCHNMTYHLDRDPSTIPDPQVYLNDVDGGTPVIYDGTGSSVEPFCLGCHDENGANGDMTPFSDNNPVPDVNSSWDSAAHNTGGSTNSGYTCLGNGLLDGTGCHDTAHGSKKKNLLAPNDTAANPTDHSEEEEGLCYNCHSNGNIINNAISGSGLADDIQQAFGMGYRHPVKDTESGHYFTIGSETYELECTTCHDPHKVTGKYWDAESGKTPITRPFSKELWGNEAGETMDDFAAVGSGSGGWYYSVARGRTIYFDRPAVYQPPKIGSGYDFEFGGDVLPDYATFCLDCHTNRMGNHPPVNWGQGIGCTGNSVDPPDQRIACNAPHGLGPANRPYYWGDVGIYGNSGNPDPIFNESGVTRGRGAGHFMRWPYDSVHKNAGINFVMSCTDCHEAHGSTVGSMVRTNPNSGTGTTIWNTMCNNCHYYYGGQHAGMSCGSASCHETNSIHRIIKNGESSGGTYLWTEPSRPTITPEIDTVTGVIGGNELMVTFTQGVYTNVDQTGALVPGDFVMTDMNGNNPRTITGVIHTPGSSIATITMSAPLIAADMFNDTLATAGISIWDSEGDPAGPWPVTINMGIVSFQLNEPAGSTSTLDESGLIAGGVNDPGETITGDGFFHGDSIDNYIVFENRDSSLQASGALTLEVRIKPSGLEGTTNHISRIFARDSNQNYQLSVWRNNDWVTYNAPSGVASIAFWVSPVDKHNGTSWKPVLTDYDTYPIVSEHWYRIKVVWNSHKTGGIPCDIFVDDQGTDGNDTGEKWSGYRNAMDSDQSQLPDDRKLFEGDRIMTGNGNFTIGCNVNNHSNNVFNGLIDWIIWQSAADYSGVD